MEVRSLIQLEQDDGSFKTIIEKVESDYKVYKLTPDRMIENGKHVEEFLKTVSSVRSPLFGLRDKKVIVDQAMPIHYELLIEKGSINFYYVIPDKYDKVVTNKLKRTYYTSTIQEAEDYFDKFKDKYYCEFVQKKHFMFSLNTDYRENAFIEGIMSYVSNISKEDTVLLQISMLPLDESWRNKWNHAYEKIRDGQEIEVNHNIIDMVLNGGNKVIESTFGLMDMMMGVDNTGSTINKGRRPERERMTGSFHGEYYSDRNRTSPMGKERTRLSNQTIQKVNHEGFSVQIRLYCDNMKNIYSYSNSLLGVLKILEEDQQLGKGKMVKNKYEKRQMDFRMNKQIYSAKEMAVLMQKPNRRMQRQFEEVLESVNSVENKIPENLREGGIPIGKVKYKGEEFMTYWPNDKHMGPMHKVITGLQRTGKSSYLANFAVEAIRKGDSVFMIDTIKGCELANDVRDYMPSNHADKLIVLDFSDLDHLIPLAWNEITNSAAGGSVRDRLKKASYVAGNFEYFLETAGEMKSEQTKLSPRMIRYLSASCKVVFSIEGTNIKDVLDCLMEHDRREHFIRLSGINENTSTVQDLRRLDDEDKHGNIVTKYSEITGIIDRSSLLFNDYIMELLLSVENNNKIDFTYWADNGYCVLIKMSELEFSRTTLKTLVTLIYSKIWLAMIARGENKDGKPHRLAHIILDEVHNFPQVTDMVKLNCREAAKYGLSYVFTSHLLIDLKALLPYIKGSGANFMLFKTTTENFRLLEKELEMGGFELADCMAVKDFHTLNIINYDRDYVAFLSKVLDPLPDRSIKVDRSSIDTRCSEEYGVEYEGY